MATPSNAPGTPDAESTPEEVKISPLQSIKSPIVTVVLGKGHQAKLYPIYRDLLTGYSPLFAECLKDGWTEGPESHLKLEEESPKAFEVVVNWLFREPDSLESINMSNCNEIIQAYKMAGYLHMTQLKNDLVDHLRSYCTIYDMVPCLDMLDYIVSAGQMDSPFYQLLVKMYVLNYHNTIDSDVLDLNSDRPTTFRNGDLMHDLLIRIHEYPQKKWGDPGKETGCVYHDHSDGSACTAV